MRTNLVVVDKLILHFPAGVIKRQEPVLVPALGAELAVERLDIGIVRGLAGPEFVAKDVPGWIGAIGAKTAYIEPGSPWENGYCESFNARFRDELLDGEIFFSLREAQIIVESWRRHYNTKRPHSHLGYRPPAPETIIPVAQSPVMHKQIKLDQSDKAAHDDARAKMEDWRRDYNEIRPHSAIGNKPPISLQKLLPGVPTGMSLNHGKFQLRLAQNRRALQKR